jgi:hypothetical protein
MTSMKFSNTPKHITKGPVADLLPFLPLDLVDIINHYKQINYRSIYGNVINEFKDISYSDLSEIQDTDDETEFHEFFNPSSVAHASRHFKVLLGSTIYPYHGFKWKRYQRKYSCKTFFSSDSDEDAFRTDTSSDDE